MMGNPKGLSAALFAGLLRLVFLGNMASGTRLIPRCFLLNREPVATSWEGIMTNVGV